MKIKAFQWSLPAFAMSSLINAQSVTTATQSTDKPKYGASYVAEIAGPVFSEKSGGAIYHYLTLSRTLPYSMKLSAVGRMDTKEGNSDVSGNYVGDHYLKLSLPSLLKTGSSNISPQLRYYIPASEASKEKDIEFVVSPRIYSSKSIDKLLLNYYLISKIYSYKTQSSNQNTLAHAHWIEAKYNVTGSVSLDLPFYPGWVYQRNGEKFFNEIPMYPGATYAATSDLELQLYIEMIATNVKRETSSLGAALSLILL